MSEQWNRERQAGAGTGERSPYERLEAFAVELAHLAGDLIRASLDREIEVEYKASATGSLPPTDALTNVDREVEAALVERIQDRFPDHAILGEEGTSIFPPDHEFVWALDPIDGTQNFVNALPIYSSSIGVLHHGKPVAGAVWGASTHRLVPGVYHTHLGGVLGFEGVELKRARAAHGKLRGLGAMPHDEDQHVRSGEQIQPDHVLPWDRRHIGSGALEAAFLAAGILESAFNTGPRVWDIAAGVLLVQAAGRGAWTMVDGRWLPLETFAHGAEELKAWRRPVLMATNAAHALMVSADDAPVSGDGR